MSKGRGVSSYTHTQQQLDHLRISTIPTMRHIKRKWIITLINAILIMMHIGAAEAKIKMRIKT